MFYRIILTAFVLSCTFTHDQIHALGDSSAKQVNHIKDVICVLVMSGMEKEDLEGSLLKKLERYNINVNDLKNETIRQECIKKAKTEERSVDKSKADKVDTSKIQVKRRHNRKEKHPKIKTSPFEPPTKINETALETRRSDTEYRKHLSKPENVMKIMKLYTNLQNNSGRNVKQVKNSDLKYFLSTDVTMLATEQPTNDDVPSSDINNSNESNLSQGKTVEILNQLLTQKKITLSTGNKKSSLNHRVKLQNDRTVNNYLGLVKPQLSAEMTTVVPCCQVNNNIFSFNKFPNQMNQHVDNIPQTYPNGNNYTQKNILYEIPDKIIQEITDKVKHKILDDLKRDNSTESFRKLDIFTKVNYNDSITDNQRKNNESIDHTIRDATWVTPTTYFITRRNDQTTINADYFKKKSDKKANNTLNMLTNIKSAILKEIRKDTMTTAVPTTMNPHAISNDLEDRLNAIPLNNLVCFVKTELFKHFTKMPSNSHAENSDSRSNDLQNSFENAFNDIPHDYLKTLVIDIKNEILGNVKKVPPIINTSTMTTGKIKETETKIKKFHQDTLQDLIDKIKREINKETLNVNIETTTSNKVIKTDSILNKIPYDALKDLVSKIKSDLIKQTSNHNLEAIIHNKSIKKENIFNAIPNDILKELVNKITYEISKETSNINIESRTHDKVTNTDDIAHTIPFNVLQVLISKIKRETKKETSNSNIETTTIYNDMIDNKDVLKQIPIDVLEELMSKLKQKMGKETSNLYVETTTHNKETEDILRTIPRKFLQELLSKLKSEIGKETPNKKSENFGKNTETESILNKIPYDALQELISMIQREIKKETVNINTETTTNDENVDKESILNKIPNDVLLALISKIKSEMKKETLNANIETTTNNIVSEIESNLNKLPIDNLQEVVSSLKSDMMRDFNKITTLPTTGLTSNSTLLNTNKFNGKVSSDMFKEIVASIKSDILKTFRKQYVKTEATTIKPILTTKTREDEVGKTPQDTLLNIMANVKNEILRELKYDVTYSETTNAPEIITMYTTTPYMESIESEKFTEKSSFQEQNSKTLQEQDGKISQQKVQGISNEVNDYVMKDENQNNPKKFGEDINNDSKMNIYPNQFYKDIFQRMKITHTRKNKIILKDRKRRTTTMMPLSTVEIDIKTTKNDVVLEKMLQVLNQLNTLQETIANKVTSEKNDIITSKITTENKENILLPTGNVEIIKSPTRRRPEIIIKPPPYGLMPKRVDMADNRIMQSRRDPYVKTFSLFEEPEQEKRVLIAETYQTNSDSIPPLGIPMRVQPDPFHSLVQNQNIIVTTKPDIQVVRFDPTMFNNQKFQLNPPPTLNSPSMQLNPPSPPMPLVPQNYKYRPPLSHLDFEEYFANNNHIMGANTYNQKSDVYDTPQQQQNPQNKYDYNQQQQPINKAFSDQQKRAQNQYPFKFFQNQPFDQNLNLQLGYDYPQIQPDLAGNVGRYQPVQETYRPVNNQAPRFSETPRYQRPKSQQGVYRKVESKKKYLRTRDDPPETDQVRSRIGDIIDSRERDRKVNSIEKRITKVTRVPKRKQESLKKRPSTYDDAHFKNFLKTQQKVNQMLEKILSTKKAVNSVELLKKR